jgi:hypothetical protein
LWEEQFYNGATSVSKANVCTSLFKTDLLLSPPLRQVTPHEESGREMPTILPQLAGINNEDVYDSYETKIFTIPIETITLFL